QGTPYNSYNYFVNVSKRINDNHQISLTAFGAPQTHYQRNSANGLSIEGYQEVKNYMNGESMYKYNPTFGYDKNGQMRNSSYNYYHKPQISLSHIWQISEINSLSTSVYASFANGGGYSGQGSGLGKYTYSTWYGATNGQLNTTFRCPDGTFDYAAIQELNANSLTGSELVMTQSTNSHTWVGLVSSYKHEINQSNGNRLNLTGGLDVRYYVGFHKNVINDLYDGEYFIDYSSRRSVKSELNSAAADPAWAYEKLGVGDVVYRNYNGYTAQEGIYAQGEYTMLDNRLNLVVSGAVNNNTYWRRDFFYYDKEHERSATTNFVGGTIKGGANYNIDKKNNVFFNLGYISRAPFFSGGVFLNSTTSNIINDNAVNEKVYSFEVGYGFTSKPFALTFNGYYTRWMDKTTTRGGTIDKGEHEGDRYYMNMEGVDALHMGLELNLNWVPARWVSIDGMVSVGDWKWDSNASGYFYNQLGQPLADLNGNVASGIMAPDHLHATINQKGIKVGGSAQTTASISANFIPFKGFRIGADWVVNSNNYSDYQISAGSLGGGDVNVAKPWRIPWGQQVDLNASYRFNIGGVNATLYGNVYNLFNNYYVVDAYTSTSTPGTWQNAYRVFYSFGRTYSLRLKINF
ncbi:MAG: TonB-dependent receptor, partial [Muribaculaceae bacterium]|nr:TonB-dependent receptor [Muribaculaceae bacterium]